MKIAILGATSQIAKDLVLSLAASIEHEITLFARRPAAVHDWLSEVGLAERYKTFNFQDFTDDSPFDAILNFVGVGNPAQAAAMGAAIFDVTLQYDELVLSYLKQHPTCRYLFLSSGAAYGAKFDAPVDANSPALIAVNNLLPQDWYAVAKLHAECRHRSLSQLPIVDIRVFNYFSHTQDLSARFLITDILRAIRDGVVLRTSSDFMVRDFLHPSDFFQLVDSLLNAPPANDVVDCYSCAPINKINLLTEMQETFGLRYETHEASGVNATGSKPHYYSLNKRAADFGYRPLLTSLEGVMKEAMTVLKQSSSKTGFKNE